MVKKLKALAEEKQDGNLSVAIRESAQQIWTAGLGAFAKAQQGGNKVFEALMREGEAIQKKSIRIAEDRVTEMAAKATGTWDKLEQVFENRVARALNSLGVPTQKDIETLTRRVAELTAQVEKLTGGVAKPAAKPAAKKLPAPAATPAAAKPVKRRATAKKPAA